MTNLTKRFTRDSMKRANPAASASASASSGGSSVVGAAVAVDLSKAQIIQTEMARARARSLRTFDPNRASRNQQQQQQQHQQRMVAALVAPRRGRDGSPAAEEGQGLPHQHPNNHHNNHNNHHHLDDQSHSEILTTMSSLTEPTWAPSMSMDVPSAHQRRLRPGGHQHHHHHHQVAAAASTSFYQQQQMQQQQQMSSRYQEHYHHLPSRPSTTHEGRQNDDSPTFEVDREGAKKSHGDRQVTTASDISSRGRDDTSIPPVAGPRAAADYATTLHTRNSELRDPPPPVMTAVVVGTDDAPAAASFKTKSRRSLSSSSSSRRSSKTITDDNHGGEVRRSKRSASTSSSTRHRSSSISSRRSSGTTAGTTTRIRSSSRARNNNTEATVGGEATAAGTVRRTSGRSAEDGGDSSAPASSSPLLSRRPRIYKSPTDESGIVTTKDERAGAGGGGGSGSGSSDDGSTVLTSADKEIANMVANNQISLATAIGTMAQARARSYSHDNDSHNSNNHRASSAGTLAPQAAHVAAAPHNRFVGGVTTRSTTTMESVAAAPPKSAMEAARMSLRPTLHRSTSNRSMASSVQSEAIMSAASPSMQPQQHLQQRHTGARTDAPTPQRLMSNDKVPSRGAPSPVASSVYPTEQATGASVMSQQPHPEPRSSSKASPPKMKNNVDVSRYNQQYPPQERSSKSSWVGLLLTAVWFVFKTLLWTLPTELLGVVFGLRPNRRWTVRRRTVLVTGASTAVGAEMARQLAMDGARLALVDWCRVADLEALAAECRDLGSGRVHCYAANLANPTSAQLAIQQASKDFGNRFDVVILNGDTKAQGCYFEEINDVGQIEQLLKQNVLGCCIALHHALPHVPKSRESRIVILSSTAGLIGSPYQSVYSATQHALTGFCQSLRMELNHTYSASKAPRVCLVSLPELASGASNNNSSGNNNGPRKHPPTHNEHRILDMGAALPPARGYSWAGIPLPHAVRGLLKAVALGRRDYGAPTYLTAWRFLQVWAPALVDWSIGRHVHQSHYRPLVDDNNSHQQHHYHNHNHNQNQNQNHNHSFEKKIRMGSRQQTEAVPSSSSSSSFFIDKIGTNPSNASNETWS